MREVTGDGPGCGHHGSRLESSKPGVLSVIALISSTIRYNLSSRLKELVLCHEEKYLESGD